MAITAWAVMQDLLTGQKPRMLLSAIPGDYMYVCMCASVDVSSMQEQLTSDSWFRRLCKCWVSCFGACAAALCTRAMR